MVVQVWCQNVYACHFLHFRFVLPAGVTGNLATQQEIWHPMHFSYKN